MAATALYFRAVLAMIGQTFPSRPNRNVFRVLAGHTSTNVVVVADTVTNRLNLPVLKG